MHKEKNIYTLRNILWFAIPSLLGVFCFMTPIPYKESFSIPIAILKDELLSIIGDRMPLLIAAIMVTASVGYLLSIIFKPKAIWNSRFLKALFVVAPIWGILRIVGTIFTFMVMFNSGPEMILNADTGTFVYSDLLPTLFSVFIFAGFLLPLLTHFGLLELFGTWLTKIMRPLFNLPGRSAIDCLASWLGDGSVGIIMSSKQYEEKSYTQREAAVIGTTFSAVSISFCLVVLSQVKLDHLFVPFYAVVCITGIIVAIIVPRMPPLSRKTDKWIDGSDKTVDKEAIPKGENVIKYGFYKAVKTTDAIEKPWHIVLEGLKNSLDMLVGILPVVMAIGTIGLIISTYTPIFEWLGMPFVPLLKLLQIPEAVDASKCMVVGFADMFIPSILASSIANEMTRFIIAAVSVTQLIFLSEVGALLLGSKIPINLWELFIIFLQRTLVSLPIIAILAHLIF
ncbi:YjiH family protein [Halosquirtibacter xylanolyticus]|uniref:YjiH family protein n=1 Tax=Halosquirtibacter xylanolyticus TaxID=3374599 RepID=UPI0037494D8A|nr:YjiH family protein [Prolixibacteraceae bacterium]